MPLTHDELQQLAAQSGRAAQQRRLKAANLYDNAGLAQLLDAAAEHAEIDIQLADSLATLVAAHAAAAAAPELAGKADYFAAQTAAMRGDFDRALQLIERAQIAFLRQGDDVAFWRTTVGLMRVLGELGRYDQALARSATALQQMTEGGSEGVAAIRARIHANRGLCFYHLGQFEQALAACDQAEFESDSFSAQEHGFLLDNRVLALTALGRFTTARTRIEAAVAAGDADSYPIWHARRLLNLGHLLLQMADFMPSLDALAEARRLFAQHQAEPDRLAALIDTGEAYLALNLHDDARQAFAEAVAGLTNLPYEHARAQAGLGVTLLALGKSAEAAAALQTALELSEKIGNDNLLALVLTERAALLLQQQQIEAASAALDRAEAAVTTDLARLFVLLRRADLQLLQNDLAAVEQTLQAAATLQTPRLPHLQLLLDGRLGRLRQRQGDDAAAEQLLLRAVATVEATRSTLTREALRTSFLQNKTDVFEALLQLYLNQGRLEQAFEIAERAKARTLIDLMAGALTNALSANVDEATQQRLQSLRAELNALYNQLLDSSQSDRGVSNRLQQQALQVEAEIRRLLDDVGAGVPIGVAATLSFAQIQQQLTATTPLIAYHILEDEVIAFVVRAGRLQVLRAVCTTAALDSQLDKLQSQWNLLRAGRMITDAHVPQLERAARHVLQQLHELLFQPLAALLPPDGQLVIIPHGRLHQLPFQALHDGSRYLLDRFALSYAPSTTVYLHLLRRNAPPPRQALIFGTSAGLKHVAAEVRAIDAILPGSTVFLNEKATTGNLKQALAGGDLLHIASHGLFRAQNPRFSALKLEDGWLTADEIGKLPSAPTHVTLSACDTGRAQVLNGDESVGLAQAFLAAGSASLLVTLWPVQDEVAAMLMPLWYAGLLGAEDNAARLRRAQQAVRLQHSHPYYWAPFVLIGKR